MEEAGDSSEGILCSSDDEIYDGLSEAIEGYIGQVEGSINNEFESPSTSELYAQNQHSNNSNVYPADRQFHSYAMNKLEVPFARCSRPPPSRRQPFLYRSHSPEPIPSAYVHGRMLPYPQWGQERPTDVIRRCSPPSYYLSTPRTDIMRQRFRSEDARVPLDHIPTSAPFSAAAGSYQPHIEKRPYDPTNQFEVPHSQRHFLSHQTSRRTPSPRKKPLKRFRNKEKQAELEVAPRPINFRISKVPSKLSQTRLKDGFFDSDELQENPEEMPHDNQKTENEIPDEVDPQNKKEKGKENSPDNKDSLSENSLELEKNQNKSRTGSKMDRGKKKKIKKLSKSKSRKNRTREKEPDKGTKEDEEIHTEILTTILPASPKNDEDVDIVYEEVEVMENAEQEKSSSLKNSIGEEEEDEELLGLRLTALTSALTQSNVQNVKKTKSVKKRKSVTKKTGPLSKNTVEANVQKPSQKRRRRSEAADLFMKKLIDLTKESDVVQSNVQSKKRKKVPNDKRLTLMEEIVRNHPEQNTKKEALRYIRSLPDSATKSEMFLELMKMDENQIIRWPKKDTADNDTCEPTVKDNYDEIEMDLEGEDEDPPEPPGTSDELIPPPATSPDIAVLSAPSPLLDMEVTEKNVPPSESSQKDIESHTDKTAADCELKPEESKDDASDNRTESKAESHKPVQPHATPTQENIWNMLEKPTLDSSQPATESSLETIPGNAEIAEEDNSVHEKKDRTLSDDVANDDKSLLLLRESLLKQMIDKHEIGSPVSQKKADVPDSVTTSNGQALPTSTVVPPLTSSNPPTLNIAQPALYPINIVKLPQPSGSILKSQPRTNPVLPMQRIDMNFKQQISTNGLMSTATGTTPTPRKVKRNRQARRRQNKRAKLQEIGTGQSSVSIHLNQNTTVALQNNGSVIPGEGVSPVVKKSNLKKKSLITKLPSTQKRAVAVPSASLPTSYSTSTSKTVFKTATTLIKRNTGKSYYGVSASQQAKMHLPKHQPVVINFHDSSEEDGGGGGQEENGADYISNQNSSLLESMIKQARMKVSQKMDKNRNKQLVSGDTWPCAKTKKDERSISQESTSTACVKLTGKLRDVPRKTLSNADSQATGKSKKLSSLSSVNRPPETVKQLKTKFLRLKVLIKNDETLVESTCQKKTTRETEFKQMQDELDELMHRVAAIKGKVTRTENAIRRFISQEAKLKERLEKRMKLKKRLLDRIKTRMMRSRVEKKSNLKSSANQPQPKKSLESKPVGERTTKLLMEKHRLLVMEKELAEKISQMKKKDGVVKQKGTVNKKKAHETIMSNGARRRVSLSKEVQSHLKKYNQTRIESSPSLHDLSLSKINILGSPARHMSPAKATVVKNVDNPTDSLVTDAKEDEATVETDVDSRKKKVDDEPKSVLINLTSSPRNAKQMAELQKLMLSYIKSVTSKYRSLINRLPFPPDMKYSERIWEKSLSDCSKNLKIDAEDILGSQTTCQGKQKRSVNESRQFLPYSSPLVQFRSHRLSPFLRTKEGLSIKSFTFSHKIDPDRIFCRYDLTGTCSDSHCKAQHRSDYELSSSQLFLDLLSYCPILLGDKVKSETSQAELAKIAETTSKRMCGLGMNKNVSMSEDQMCILITSNVNSALGTKAPFYTVFKSRIIRPIQTGNSDPDSDYREDFLKSESAKSKREHPDQSVEVEERYFVNKSKKSLHGYEKTLQKNPHDIQLWIQLAYRRLQQGKDEENFKNLELALHTMCLALEDNPYKGELWGHYLSLLKHRKGDDSDSDLHEMVSQALELVPLSPSVWKELCSWKYNVKKCKDLLNLMITNLIKNAETFKESNDQDQLPVAVASSWLLESILRRTQISIQALGVKESIDELEQTVVDFSEQCNNSSPNQLPDERLRRCLSQTHLCQLWLAYINLKFSGSLPICFLSDSNDSSRTRIAAGVTIKPEREVCLLLESKKKMTVDTYSGIRRSLYDAVKACSHPDLLQSAATASCACLYFQIIKLEIFVKEWDRALSVCQLMHDSLQKSLSPDTVALLEKDNLQKYITEILVVWADVLVRSGEIMKATHIFDNAVTERPYSAKLCYEASLLQLNLESKDVIAALLYLEACVSAFLEIEQDGLGVTELIELFRYLLRFSSPTNQENPKFKPGMNWDCVLPEKTYLWLCYCLLLTLSSQKSHSVIEAFEMALIDTNDERERETIWIRYIRYRLTMTPVPMDKSDQIQCRAVTALLRRCLKTTLSKYSSKISLFNDGYYTDYTFHNKVADMYLSCLRTRQQLSAAYTALTELMPLNIPLLLRACKYFLEMDDYASVISILWKITSLPSCQNEMIWKISIFVNYARGKMSKTIWLCKNAVEALPYSRDLWTDYLAILLSHGIHQLYEEEFSRCAYYLQQDPESMLRSLKQS